MNYFSFIASETYFIFLLRSIHLVNSFNIEIPLFLKKLQSLYCGLFVIFSLLYKLTTSVNILKLNTLWTLVGSLIIVSLLKLLDLKR